MNTKRLLCLVTLFAGLHAQAAFADNRTWQGFSAPALAGRYAAAPRISADEAAASVQRQYGGRILAVETRQQNGQVFYRIKVLTRKGVVRVVRIRAGSRQ